MKLILVASASAQQLCSGDSAPVWTLQKTGGLIRDSNNSHTVKRSGRWGHALYSDLDLGCGASKEACMSCCENDSACNLINFCPTCATGSGGTTRGGGDCRLAGTYSSGNTPASAVGWEGWSSASGIGLSEGCVYSPPSYMETENMETDTDKLVSSALDQALDTATIPGQ